MDKNLSYEVDRLKEIYSNIFPGERIKIILKAVSHDQVQEPVELNYTDVNGLLEIGGGNLNVFEVGVEYNLIPSRFFLINCSFDDVNEYATPSPKAESTFKSLVKSKLRFFLMANFPMIYEFLKELYLGRLEKKFVDYKILKKNEYLNRENSIIKSHKKILFFMHWLELGGAEKFAVNCCELASELKKEVYLISSHKSRPFYAEKLKAIAKLYELDRQVPNAYKIKFINSLIRKEEITLMHNHHSVYFYEALPSVRLNFSHVIAVDSLHIDEKNRFHGGFPRISVVWSEYIDYIHVISGRLVNYFVNKGVDRSKVIYGNLSESVKDKFNFRLINSISEKNVGICFVGRMSSQKRPLLAFVLLNWFIGFGVKNGFNVSVSIVGDGFYLESFKRAVSRSKWRDKFNFHDSTVNVQAVIARNDILLLTSENEGITLVGYEAYNAGAIVVSTDVGAQNELIPEKFLLPSNSLKAFVAWKQLINKIFNDKVFVQSGVADVQEKALNIFSSEKWNNVLIDIYGEMV